MGWIIVCQCFGLHLGPLYFARMEGPGDCKVSFLNDELKNLLTSFTFAKKCLTGIPDF